MCSVHTRWDHSQLWWDFSIQQIISVAILTPVKFVPANNMDPKVFSSVLIKACMWIKRKDTNIVIGKSADYEWDVLSEYYFSVTFKSGGTTTPR